MYFSQEIAQLSTYHIAKSHWRFLGRLKDRCLTESFRTPVPDTRTRSINTRTHNSTHQPGQQSGTTDDPNTLTNDQSHVAESDSDDELVVGKEYNAQVGLSSKSTNNMRGENSGNNGINTHSSNIEFEVQNDPAWATKRGVTIQSTIEYLYIQMELCERQTLKEWLVKNTERPKQTVLKYFLDIVNAVEHIHEKRMMHRDLKVRL